MSIGRHGQGIRTRDLLLISLLLIIAGTTASSLYIISSRLHRQVENNLEQDLRHSMATFQDLEQGRLAALEREDALMAGLPSLKALMTTNDPKTIADDAGDFWKTSGNDLFALADADDNVLTVQAGGANAAEARQMVADLEKVLRTPSKRYLITNGRLFEYAIHPLYFGSQASGTLLGYVVNGFRIDHEFLSEVGRGAGADAAFVVGNTTAVTTLPKEKQDAVSANAAWWPRGDSPATAMVGRERYLAASKDLSDGAAAPLRLVVMKSFDEADRAEREINRLVFLVSLLAVGAGSMLMLLLARMVTRPLELLSAGVRALGESDLEHPLPENGTQEVRYLSRVFAEMRDEIQKTNRALLEAERLATIGRMASSVSHDLRHYLAAVYANAEFLASPSLPLSDRVELFEEIRMAVNGTADMLDSLLIFSRTGAALQRIPATMTSVVERAVALVRTHPDAERVALRMDKVEVDTLAALDVQLVERAVYNLLLNACQSAQQSPKWREVHVKVSADSETVGVTITDSGPGVAEGIRDSLFQPFVSQGRQKGTGLGLTLAWSVAREHDGDARLVRSSPGETVFLLTLARNLKLLANSSEPPASKVMAS